MDSIVNRWKVRVIAKIRGFSGDRPQKNSISVHRPNGEASDAVFLSFGGQSSSHQESYRVDYCYEPNEDNSAVFLREIEPLVSEVFEGRSVTAIAYGAQGSGMTSTIEGSEETPGLAVLAMDEIVKRSELTGSSVSISVYEVRQENICDLLNPVKKALSVLEDVQGSIIVKGLSQATVNSVLEFQKLYTGCSSSCKPDNKIGNETSRRSHKGLIIHVTSPTENSKAPFVGKMNFLDLAGYEDARKKNNSGLSFAATSRTNKALYALHKVVRALNVNNIYVPFRESKVTRMLQESLEGSNKVLIIACLNAFCQDSVYMAKLASESCPVQQFIGNSSRKLKSRTRPTTFSSCKNRLPQSKSISTQKIIGNRVHFLQRSANTSASAITGKKLFDDDSHINQTKQESSTSAAESTVENEVLEKESSVVAITNATKNEPEDADNLPLSGGCLEEVKIASENDLDKENYGVSVKEDGSVKENGSPLLSVQLQELSNNLKKLYYSTPSVMVQHKNKLLCNDTLPLEGFEPKTPTTTFKENESQNLSPIKSPLVASRTCYPETKNSLAQEYLRFINSASKEELKGLKGIGERRASNILRLRETSPEPFKQLDDLKIVGLSAKQIKKMLAIK